MLGILPEGDTVDELATPFVWLTASPTELDNVEDCRVTFTTELPLSVDDIVSADSVGDIVAFKVETVGITVAFTG